MLSPVLFPGIQGPLATQIPAWISKNNCRRKAKESGEMEGHER